MWSVDFNLLSFYNKLCFCFPWHSTDRVLAHSSLSAFSFFFRLPFVCPWTARFDHEYASHREITKSYGRCRLSSVHTRDKKRPILKERKEVRRLMGRQGHRNVVWHRHILYFDILVYSQPSKAVPPYFSTARKIPPYLGVPGTAEGGTAIFQYRQKNTAIFGSTGNRRRRYRHISVPSEKYRRKNEVPGTA